MMLPKFRPLLAKGVHSHIIKILCSTPEFKKTASLHGTFLMFNTSHLSDDCFPKVGDLPAQSIE